MSPLLVVGRIRLEHRGERGNLRSWRDRPDHQIDVVIDKRNKLVPVEVESGATDGERSSSTTATTQRGA